jgi:hypothetical protein
MYNEWFEFEVFKYNMGDIVVNKQINQFGKVFPVFYKQ